MRLVQRGVRRIRLACLSVRSKVDLFEVCFIGCCCTFVARLFHLLHSSAVKKGEDKMHNPEARRHRVAAVPNKTTLSLIISPSRGQWRVHQCVCMCVCERERERESLLGTTPAGGAGGGPRAPDRSE
jgi:hypothetical protein